MDSTELKPEPAAPLEEREYRYWGRVYTAVIIYTILTILGLWAFSRLYQ